MKNDESNSFKADAKTILELKNLKRSYLELDRLRDVTRARVRSYADAAT